MDQVAEIEKMFEADWKRESFTPTLSNLIISPYNSRVILEALLKNAVSEIDIEMEVFTDKKMLALLSEKAKTTKITVILPDLSKIEANSQTARKLEDAGIDVRLLSKPYLHAKLIVIDDQKAYVGSIILNSLFLSKAEAVRF